MKNKFKQFLEVKNLVLKGITSPTTIMNLVGIKQWSTAKKLIQAVQETIEFDDKSAMNECISIVNSLIYLRSIAIYELEKTKHINHKIGLTKNIISINKQLESMLNFQKINKIINEKEENKLRNEAIERLRKANLIP